MIEKEKPKDLPLSTPKQVSSLLPKAIDRTLDFAEEYAKESDRAAVVLIGAKLEYLLLQLLTKALIPNATTEDNLLDTDRPLGSFSARIHMSYRMGLIDAEFARALHIFRKIRNSFAHELSGVSLESGSHADRIREIVAPIEHLGTYNKMREVIFPTVGDIKSALFIGVAMMIISLEKAIADAQEFSVYRSPATYTSRFWEK